ncbi:hypothetical protein F0562_031089 [Nyssa sinensis]|uniref:FAS1 domain-containing protein n=1 Tax=Nyssa sinensis TaxID=561372 RepID=A0A5J5AVJ4_9ASTE|nr:hypothetical protein F0562_031089 [Nyssa sinensis]
MAISMNLSSVLLMTLMIISRSTATNMPSRNQDLLVAIEEMQTANYFTFVMLINMAPANLFQGNVTFLMPNDRTLSRIMMPENAVADFLLRHSIPSPLLFNYLEHIPTGSIIPTSKPEFMLKISNNGRRSFYLNNVRIISPNLCTAGSSIRCHGIDGAVQPTKMPEHNTTHPLPSCSNRSASPVAPAVPPAPLRPSPAPAVGGLNLTPSTAPTPTETNDSTPQKSGSSQRTSAAGFISALAVATLGVDHAYADGAFNFSPFPSSSPASTSPQASSESSPPSQASAANAEPPRVRNDNPRTTSAGFDPEALERGAKALREISSSAHAKKVFEGMKKKEETRQTELAGKASEFKAMQAQAETERQRVIYDVTKKASSATGAVKIPDGSL